MFGKRPVRSLDRAEVQRWWRGLHSTKRKSDRLSDRNANKLLTELKACLGGARDDYGLDVILSVRPLHCSRADLPGERSLLAFVSREESV